MQSKLEFNRQLTAYYTLARRELVRILRIWPQTLLPPIINISLYFLIFGSVIGNKLQLGGARSQFSYAAYLVPGLIMMAIINNSYVNVVSSLFGSKFQRNIEEMLIAPMQKSVLIAGFISGGLVRGLLIGCLVLIMGYFYTGTALQHPWVALMVAMLVSVVFALLGFLNGLFAKSFDDISIIPTFVLSPLTYLGGVFYSIEVLPEFWRKLSLFNPILYMVNAFRYACLGYSEVPIMHTMLILLLLTGGLYGLCLYGMQQGWGSRY